MGRQTRTEADSLEPECDFTIQEKFLLAYNLPPLEPLAVYARNQCKFLKVVDSLHVRDLVERNEFGEEVSRRPLILKKVTVWCNHRGEIEYYFDPEEAQRWIDFIEEKGRHKTAEWRGLPLKLAHWQKWIIREFFGWRRINTAYRRYKYWFDYCPRKNGKTLLISTVSIGLLTIDGEKAPEIYDIGSAKDQSDTLFSMAQFQCGYEEAAEWADADLIELCQVSTNLIETKFNGGIFRPLPFSPGAFHGKNPSGLIVEEYHAHPTDEMRDVGTTGQGVRQQPVVIIDTTAGEDTDTPCYEELLVARDIRDGVIVQPNYLPVIFEASENDPWDSLETAKKCNPMYGISLTEEFFKDSIAMAKIKPLQKRRYVQLQLNRFVQDSKAAFDFDFWIKGRAKYDFRQFRNEPIGAGLDLASIDDLSFLAMVAAPDGIDGNWYTHFHAWCPEEVVTNKKTVGNYGLWKEQGFLVATPGNATDYTYVYETIEAYSKYFNFALLNVDRYNATWLAQKLMGIEGLPVEFFGQGTASMTEPIKFLLTLYMSGRLKHNNPIIDWMVKNTILYGNDRACKFEKKSATVKIDGLVALAMAVAALLRKLSEASEGGSGIWIE